MAKADTVSIRSTQLELTHIANFYTDLEQALELYYNPASPKFGIRFASYLPIEVSTEHFDRLDELDVTCAMTVITKMEASFRIDYLLRCRQKKKDHLSRDFREIYKAKAQKVSLEDEILKAWKNVYPVTKKLMDDLGGALRYRHWVAHGRYWEPKFARKKYDFVSVYSLAEEILKTLPLYSE